MTSHRITILIATHNGEKYIAQQLDSILAQTCQEFSIIIMDDCSSDHTDEIIHAYVNEDKRIAFYKNTERMGAIKTFERLLHRVDTPLFCLCDQDDVWLPQKLELSLSALTDTGADIVYTNLRLVDQNLCPISGSMWTFSNIIPIEGKRPLPLIIKNSITGCTLMGRTDLLRVALPFPQGIPMHDWWLAVVAACRNGVTFIKEPQVLYRQHASNDTGASRFGLDGLIDQMRKKKLSLGGYLQYRLDSRVTFIDALSGMGFCPRYRVLKFYYQSSIFVRFFLSPIYFVTLVFFARQLGLRNIMVDTLMTALPFFVRR